MKKAFILLAMALLTLGATSCLGDKDDQTANMNVTMHNRAVSTSGDDIKLSLTNYTVTVNYSQSTITIAGSASLADGSTVQFTTPDMAISTNSSQYTYTFSASSISAGTHTLTGFQGTLDMYTGYLYVSFTTGSSAVYASTGVSFPYSTTTAVDTTGAASPYENTSTGYYFSINPSTSKATMLITGFVLSAEDANRTSSSTFSATDALDATLTTTGYVITGDVVVGTSSTLSNDTLRNVRAVVTQSGQALSLTYTHGAKKATARGTLFRTSN